MRSDLKQVEDKVSRLLEYADTFASFDSNWSHLKNQEDYPRESWLLPPEEGGPIEALYADGRQAAVDIKNWFWNINTPEEYPTLKSFVDVMIPALENKMEDSVSTLESAKKAHNQNGHKYWAVGQMIDLLQKQIDLMASSLQTLQLLKTSNLYREENGEKIMDKNRNVTINKNTYNNSNVNSENSSVNVNHTKNKQKKSDISKWTMTLIVGVVVAVIAAMLNKHFGFL